VERIGSLLEQAFDPIELEIIDESHLHAGHVGAKDGKGHFRVRIVSRHFEGQKTLRCHRMVYEALRAMMASDIHALSVAASAPTPAAMLARPKQEDET
jgi:BolA protein